MDGSPHRRVVVDHQRQTATLPNGVVLSIRPDGPGDGYRYHDAQALLCAFLDGNLSLSDYVFVRDLPATQNQP